MNEHRDRLARRLLLAALFLLPWPTRVIFATPSVGHAVWQYGVISLYVTEVLVLAAVALLGWDRIVRGIVRGLGRWPPSAFPSHSPDFHGSGWCLYSMPPARCCCGAQRM